MRRALAILLLIIFGLPYTAVFFGSEGAGGSLPVCCRKNGKHHCAMMSSGSPMGEKISVVSEKCPYSPALPAALKLAAYSAPVSAGVFAELYRHPAVHAQTEAKYRISSDSSRQKRGPPSLILL